MPLTILAIIRTVFKKVIKNVIQCFITTNYKDESVKEEFYRKLPGKTYLIRAIEVKSDLSLCFIDNIKASDCETRK